MVSSNDMMGRAAKDFLAEAEEIVDQLTRDMVDLSDCAEDGDCNPDIINSIFRGAHSLKGLAGMFGFREIGDLAHNLENLLDSLRLGKVSLSHDVVTVLFEALELLAALVRSCGSETAPPDISPAIAGINSCLSAGPAKGGDSPLDRLGLPEKVLSALTEYEEHRLLENLRKGRRIHSLVASFSILTFDQDLGELTDLLKQRGEVISTLPSAGGNLESSIDFEILYGTELEKGELTVLVDRDNIYIQQFGGGDVSPEPEAAPASGALVPAPDESAVTAKSMSRTVRVDIAKLDELMNIVGELVLSHFAIAGLVEKVRGDGFTAVSIELGKTAKILERKLNELQKGVMEIRMIPVGHLFDKMSRIVRKISREQGKRLELKLYGAETELDKQIMEDISDPMMHIIRNAIDHGIEPSDERLRTGKGEKGTIRLSAYQKGNHVVIEVEDDGRGIDLEKVKRKAVEKGLIRSAEGISDRDAIDLIFLPGFSTSETVSEISGRGVGMDVVKNNITAISGMVDVESEKGKGSRVTITLPITLAIIKSLIISSSGRTYAIPITSVLESLQLRSSDILTVERREVLQLREHTLPLVRLDRFFGSGESRTGEGSLFVVVVGIAEKRLGLVVDDLVGQQDIVIKGLGDTFSAVNGISGAADLGDQRTILVLDVGGIVNEVTRSA
jgi:two-component system, chemotaxis family, sensor kinase CheA